jgi:drug/metabolite transporter (DMT)-like permease
MALHRDGFAMAACVPACDKRSPDVRHESGLPLQQQQNADTSAKLMLVAIGFAWGLTWPAMRIALDEVPPVSMRVVTLGLGAGVLFLVGWMQGRSFALNGFKHAAHLFVAGMLNVWSFSLLSVVAMMYAGTGRVAMLAYTMPIWAALFAWLVLGERLTRVSVAALGLCIAGMTILIWPLAQQSALIGLLIAVSIAVSWAAGTVYVKWARLTGDSVMNAAWQVFVAFVVVTLLLPVFEGSLHVTQAHGPAIFGLIWSGLIGSGLAYFLWFGIVRRVPAMTASLGVLSAPVIGVVSTAVFLGEIPTAADIVGYVLIFAASVCVLLPGR